MKVIDKLLQGFDDKFKPNEINGPKLDELSMFVQEFSDLYEIKKYVLAKELA
jgi:hypothetical protein